MRGNGIVLIGIGAAVLYGLASHAISGSWNFALAFEIGVVVALAISGFRKRPMEEARKEEKAGGESRLRAEEESGSAGKRVDAASSHRSSDFAAPSDLRSADMRQEKEVASSVARGGDAVSTRESPVQSPPPPTPPPNTSVFSAAPAAGAPAAETPDEIWERARVMPHAPIPDLIEDAAYLNLVFSAAERGCVPALAKLGEYAFRRGAFIEAYFWTKIAKRRLEGENGANQQGVREIDEMLRNIRRAWTAAGQPPEFENVYDNFPEERGELGRAFLRLDSGIEVNLTRKYVRALAEKGNPDAALFV